MSSAVVLRVLSYNIHKGFTAGNRNFVLPAMREAISALQPDVVFLQEVLGQHDKHALRQNIHWPALSQFEFLAEGIWPHFAYGKNAIYLHGHHGNAILSKYPIVEWSNTDISTNAFESRGILHAVIDVPGCLSPVHCMCVHLNMLRRGRSLQLERLCGRVLSSVPNNHPLIVAGDFNDWGQHASPFLRNGVQLQEVFFHLHGAHAVTYPSLYPVLPLDRIYARGLESTDGEILIQAPWSQLSDHAALYAEFLVQS